MSEKAMTDDDTESLKTKHAHSFSIHFQCFSLRMNQLKYSEKLIVLKNIAENYFRNIWNNEHKNERK